MRYSKRITVLLVSVACATLLAVDAGAQSRGRSGGRSGGGRSGGGHGPSIGRAVPRSGGSRVDGPRGGFRSYGSRVIVSPRVVGRPYYRSYYPYRSTFSLGFYAGYPFYGYPYSYGYPYAYGYPYGSYVYASRYGYPYGGYGYGGYGYGGYGYGGYGYGGGEAYGGVRIQDAPRDAQVFVDGYYAGIVDDFDGPFQHLSLEAGSHQIEIRAPGFPPMTFDVNVQPGRTLNLHAR